MRQLIGLFFLTTLIAFASYWLAFGMLNLAEWAGFHTFSIIMAGWSALQFLTVALLGESKRRNGHRGDFSH